MRDPNRLDKFYEELKEIHKKSYPDMREGQFLLNALGWISIKKKIDPFFPESEQMLDLFKEYANSHSKLYYGRGWELVDVERTSN